MDFKSILQLAHGVPGAQTGYSWADPTKFYGMPGDYGMVQTVDETQGMRNTPGQTGLMTEYGSGGMKQPGESYWVVDPSTGQHLFQDKVQADNWMQGLALAGLGAAGAYFLPGMLGGGGFGGMGAIDGAGGMSLAEGAYPSSLGFGDVAGTAGVGGAGVAGGAGGGLTPAAAAGGMGTITGPAAGDAAFNTAVSGAGAAGVNPMISSLAGTLGMSPSALTGLLAAGGALLGSQGVKSTQTRDIPDWLKPYANQQLSYGSGLLDQQMNPAYLQAANDIRSGSMGLLAPQQQANFSRFFPGR